MSNKKSLPSPLTILMIVIVFAAISTWLLPAGEYSKLSSNDNKTFQVASSSGVVTLPFTQRTLDSLSIKISLQKFIDGDIRKPVSVPGSYKRLEKNPQGFIKVLEAPVQGIIDSIDIALFVLIIGGFMYVFNETGAILKGVEALSHRMKGREPLLIIILIFLFSFLRGSYGMEEEALVFYPVLVPLFLAAGYDLLLPLVIIFGGTTIGGVAAFTNPFSTIIASNAAGINWTDGLYERLLLWLITTVFMVYYTLRYASKVKKDHTASLVYKIDGNVHPPYEMEIKENPEAPVLSTKTKMLLVIYLATFISMIIGIVFFNWWTLEMSALFLGAAILVAVITQMNEKKFITEFVAGAGSLLSVALIIGVARGVTIVLNDGHVSDSILFYASGVVQHFSPVIFIVMLMVFFLFFSLFISSTSGMAVLTMPIMGALAIIINIPSREIVNSYLYGMNIMNFLSPTGILLPSLAIVNVSLKVWLRFIVPVVIVLLIVCAAFLIIGIAIK